MLFSFTLFPSAFHIRAIFNHSLKGRLNLFWFTHGIVGWCFKYMNNYWEHEYSWRKNCMAKSSGFFMSLYIIISCGPRSKSINMSCCESVPSFPAFPFPFYVLLYIFFLSLFLSSFSTFRKCWINFLLQFFSSLPHDFSISFQINLPCHLVSLEFSNYSVYKAWLVTDGTSKIHTSTMYILGPEIVS